MQVTLTPNPSPKLGEGSRTSDGVRASHRWRRSRGFVTPLEMDYSIGLIVGIELVDVLSIDEYVIDMHCRRHHLSSQNFESQLQ